MIVGQNYKIVAELGSGGMGVVYQAVDLTLEREVALKKLRPEFSRSVEVGERFKKEAKIQARMNHPGIVQLFAMFKDDDSFYMAMEFVDGTPLGQVIPLSWQRAVATVLQILSSLEYAHSLGVLHRDIKPDNIVVDSRGLVKVMDFGIAHVLGAVRQTREKSIIGTLEYMAPERITAGRDVDKRSDIYSLGILLFEMIAGRLPFDCETEYELLKHQIETPLPRIDRFCQGVPEFIEAAVARAAAKDPALRFANCAEMADSLRAGAAALLESGWDRPDRQLTLPAIAIERWRKRVDGLTGAGEFEVAQRVLEEALTDFPANPLLEACRDRIAAGRTSHSEEASTEVSDRHRYIRESLSKMQDFERESDWQAGRDLAREALKRYPSVRAFSLALSRFEREVR